MQNESITHFSWIKRWAGSYTFISCSYWGKQYYHSLQDELGSGFAHSLFTHRKGVVSFFLVADEFKGFGETMAQKVVSDANQAKEWLKELKANTDRITEIMTRLKGSIPSQEEYEEFLYLFHRHLPFHNFMKKTVDFLPADVLKEWMPLFKDARIYSEPVYSDTEAFFRALAQAIAQKENRNAEFLTCLSQDELEEYLRSNQLPEEEILAQRYNSSILFFENGEESIVVGNVADHLEEIIAAQHSTDLKTITGMKVFPGIVKGRARIVADPLQVGEFNEGDILVTGMTRPEFLPLVKKSAGIVTDAGGILCHAAITAREFKKPCIVGTQNATQRIKDGQLVELDAENDLVRIL